MARELCAAGADLINDPWGGWDERLPEVAAPCGVGLVCSHVACRPIPEHEEDAPDGETVVEVTLLELGADHDEDLNDHLELIGPATGPNSMPSRPAGS